MLFQYKAIDQTNATREGTVEATNVDAAIATVQKRGYTVVSIDAIEESGSIWNFEITWFQSISNKEVVILSRQIATLFDAQVSALRIFRLLAAEAENPQLRSTLNGIADDLQAGSSISRALGNYPDVFSPFYVNMVRAGEESGSMENSFNYLADYLDRTYQVITKARNALIYPAFVIGVFILVMGLMLTLVIPRISQILIDSGQELPIYTKIVISISTVLSNYIGVILVLVSL
ncbi:MAG: type II secretion system F family protein, partial [Bacteroidota bacterium]